MTSRQDNSSYPKTFPVYRLDFRVPNWLPSPAFVSVLRGIFEGHNLVSNSREGEFFTVEVRPPVDEASYLKCLLLIKELGYDGLLARRVDSLEPAVSSEVEISVTVSPGIVDGIVTEGTIP